MKVLFDLLPVIFFFAAYTAAKRVPETASTIVSSLVDFFVTFAILLCFAAVRPLATAQRHPRLLSFWRRPAQLHFPVPLPVHAHDAKSINDLGIPCVVAALSCVDESGNLERLACAPGPDGVTVDQLREVSVASRINKPIGDKMIMNAAFLIARDQESAFDAKVKLIATRFDKLTFKYTGPWPPYNFVNIRLKLERA
jgi:hypothetical protein